MEKIIASIATNTYDIALTSHEIKLGKKILAAIEKAGMLPPYNNEGLSNYDIAMGSNVNKWESEDD